MKLSRQLVQGLFFMFNAVSSVDETFCVIDRRKKRVELNIKGRYPKTSNSSPSGYRS